MVVVEFLQLSLAVGEGDGEVEVCVIIRGQTERNISVTVSAMSGTASGRHARFHIIVNEPVIISINISDEDFHTFTTDLTYTPSLDRNQTLCVNITIMDDSILENEEDFTVSISSTDSSVITGPPSTISIIDNDGINSEIASRSNIFIM